MLTRIHVLIYNHFCHPDIKGLKLKGESHKDLLFSNSNNAASQNLNKAKKTHTFLLLHNDVINRAMKQKLTNDLGTSN